MHTQVGTCPHCGSPIYAPTVWHGVTPPPSTRTCDCVPIQQDRITTTTDTTSPTMTRHEAKKPDRVFGDWFGPYWVKRNG